MEDNGYQVKVESVSDLKAVHSRYKVPEVLGSCHTAIVDGYVIEGHIPVAEIRQLSAERPDIVGLAMPKMPADAPKMRGEDEEPRPYKVFAFNRDGKWQVFTSYPK